MGCLGPRHFDGQERSSKHFLLTREILLVVLGVCFGVLVLGSEPLDEPGLERLEGGACCGRHWQRLCRLVAQTGENRQESGDRRLEIDLFWRIRRVISVASDFLLPELDTGPPLSPTQQNGGLMLP